MSQPAEKLDESSAVIVRTATPTALAPAPQNFTEEQVQLIKDSYCKGASDGELHLFLAVCKRTRLDPFARQIFAVKRWDGNLRREVLTPQTSVDGFRLTAQRTGEYRGQKPAQWCGPDGIWRDVWLGSQPPSAARVGVMREGFAEPIYAVATYRSYVQTKKDGSPNAMWSKSADNMLAKCAECLALRKAFPAELSGVYSSEEMGQAANDDTEEHRQHVAQQPKNVPSSEDEKLLTKICDRFALANTIEQLKELGKDGASVFAHSDQLMQRMRRAYVQRLNELRAEAADVPPQHDGNGVVADGDDDGESTQ